MSSGSFPAITAIIPTYGREEVLCQTLTQLLDQEVPPFEILVLDQTPEHEPATQSFLSRLHESGKIRWIRLETRSAARARNLGILEARGEVVLLLDDDIRFGRDFVAVHSRNYQDPGTIGVVGRFTGEGEKVYPTVHCLPPEALEEPFGWMEIPGNLAYRVEKPLLYTTNMSVRREVALAAGGFDENFGPLDLHADFDFAWRVRKMNAGKTYHDPEAAIFHLKAPRGGCRRRETRWHLPDPDQLYPWFYLHFKNFPLRPSLPRLLRPFRTWVLNKGNVKQPWFLAVALYRYARALGKAANMARRPPRDLTSCNSGAVEAARKAVHESMAMLRTAS